MEYGLLAIFGEFMSFQALIMPLICKKIGHINFHTWKNLHQKQIFRWNINRSDTETVPETELSQDSPAQQVVSPSYASLIPHHHLILHLVSLPGI